MYSSSLWRIDTIVFAKLNKPPQELNRGLRGYDLILSAKNGIVNLRHTTKLPFPSFLCTLISPFPSLSKPVMQAVLAGYYGTMPVFFSVSSTYHVTSLDDHSIHIILAEDTIKIVLRVQIQTVTHLHNSLPMDNGDQTWLHIDHKQNNALT